MSYIKFEARHLGDDRWLDATPAAFAVHVWALDYCNNQATDGVIAKKLAHRLNCPVEPVNLPAAWDVLVEMGWWERTDTAYICPGFLSHGIASDEQERTRDKWATDKRRRRLHDVGNHDLCTSHSRCPVAKERDSTSGKSSSPPVDKWTTRPDPNPKGEGRVGAGSLGGSAPEGATPRSPAGSKATTIPLPHQWQIRLLPYDDDADEPDLHNLLVIEPGEEDTTAPFVDAGAAIESVLLSALQTTALREYHGCPPKNCCGVERAASDSVVYVQLPPEVTDRILNDMVGRVSAVLREQFAVHGEPALKAVQPW